MNETFIKINFRGGIISPGELYNILVAASRAHVHYVSFGLRQQLIVKVAIENSDIFTDCLRELDVFFENSKDEFPNITSSYPAEEVFINNTWLSEGSYKDIFDGFYYEPTLKINISDCNQSFTPLLTGNINWVASIDSSHFWHLIIRFPKTNIVYEWNQLTYTNDIPRLSKKIETIIQEEPGNFYNVVTARGEHLFEKIDVRDYITKPADKPASLPAFNLPYYEGLNKYNNKYWLGIYRRDELFSVSFLKELCLLCLETKIGQICSTPWKTIIVKSIEDKERLRWNRLLEKYQVNVRHASNELNFQVEDNCDEGLALKNWLVKKLNDDDTRTFGICIGIKTRSKSEVFSSILVRKRTLVRFLGKSLVSVYDILCAHDFNPNERTGFVFSRNNPKFLLAEQLRRSIVAYYKYRSSNSAETLIPIPPKKITPYKPPASHVYQCKSCLSTYDEILGDPENNILPGTAFEKLSTEYTCSLCGGAHRDFSMEPVEKLGLQAI